MKKINYLLFSILCIFSFSVVFAEEVVIKSITPVYDETSTMKVTEEENLHSVIFNDKDQLVEYKIVLENTTNKDLPVDSIELSTPSEDFLVYKIEGIDSDDVIEANSSKEFSVSLETIKKEGWGRNFKDELIANISFDTTILNTNTDVINPETKDLIIIVALTTAGLVGGFIILKKYKQARYATFVIALFSLAPIIKADFRFVVPVEIQASYESQNIMEAALNENNKTVDYWQYANKIKNFYIANEFSEITNYAYRFDVSDQKDERVIAYLVANKNDANFYDLYLQADGVIYTNHNASSYFANMENLDSINNIEGLETGATTNMSKMFYRTGYSSEVFTLDLGDKFDTSNVTIMESMFYCTGHSNKKFTLDLGENFDTSNVTNMSFLFYQTGYNSTIFELNLGDKFNTGNVKNINSIFNTTGYSSEIFTLDLGDKFDTSQAVDTSHMFYKTGYSSEVFTLDLGDKFDTSNSKKMWAMFFDTGYSSKIFTLDLGDKFDTSKVTDMNWMFEGTGYSSKVMTLDLGDKFDTSKVTSMSDMFYKTGASSEVFTLDLGDKFDTSNVTTMGAMFRQTGQRSKVFTLDLGDKFDTNKVKGMSYMFAAIGMYNPNFTLDLGDKFDTSNVTNMKSMFDTIGYYSTNFSLDLGDKFDTSNVTNMNRMFSEAGYTSQNFTIDLGDKFNTSKVTDMYCMFYRAGYNSLVLDLNIGNQFDTSNVTDMGWMFNGAGPLSTKLNFEITIRNPNITSYDYIFRYTATKPSSKIVVNYTKDTETIVDAMIATKNPNTNVVKGVLVN